MTLRSLLLATALLAAASTAASAQVSDDVIAAPVLRASVNVTSDVVRIGDVIDNAGASAQIAIYRAPDLGTTGSLKVAQVLSALQAHRVIGVDTHNLKEISVTRLARTLESKDIELQVARALEHRFGLGDAANLSLTFDRDVQDLRLDASNSGAMQPVAARFDPRSNRFDVSFEIANDNVATPTRLRFSGSAIETVEAAVLARGIERNEVIKSSDVVVERRPKAEVGGDVASRDRAVGMQARKQLRAGQALRVADIAKPDLVQRDQNVTLTYEATGLYLTIRGKALENGTEGDVVSVLNLQSKRTVTGVVSGRGQVTVSAPAARLPLAADVTSSIPSSEPATPVSVAVNSASQVTQQVSQQAGLQAGADADAETGDCVVQRQFAVAERLPGVLQGSARGADRRHLDGDGEYHRQGEHRQRDPAQPHQQGRFRHHRFCRQPDAGRAGAENPAGPAVDGGLDRFQRRQGFGQPPGGAADQRRRRGDAVAAERQSRGRRQAGDPGQFRNPRTDGRRHRAPGGHPELQHHRFEQDRAGPHRLWRPRPDHRRATAALRPTGAGRAAAVLAFQELPHFIANPGRDEVFQRGLRQLPWRRPRSFVAFTSRIGRLAFPRSRKPKSDDIAGEVPSGVALNGTELPS